MYLLEDAKQTRSTQLQHSGCQPKTMHLHFVDIDGQEYLFSFMFLTSDDHIIWLRANFKLHCSSTMIMTTKNGYDASPLL